MIPLYFPDGTETSCLIYADDLFIHSRSAPGLQKCLGCLSSYCQKWKLSINMTKTKCTSFQSKNRWCKKIQFKVNNSVIENVSEYKYLGMTINAAGYLSATLSNFSENARRAIFALNYRFSLKSLPVKITLKYLIPTLAIFYYTVSKYGCHFIKLTLINGTAPKLNLYT